MVEKNGDLDFWIDISVCKILLEREEEAISAANRAKRMADIVDLPSEVRKAFLSTFGAILYRYADVHGKDQGNRLLPTLIEFQKEFPNEKIIFPVKAMDEDDNLTEDMKKMLLDQKQVRDYRRDIFRSSPVPTYTFAKISQSRFPDFICFRNDPQFTIDFTLVSPEFITDSAKCYNNAKTLIVDYLSLLDLSKTGLLGFLERTGKRILVQEALFETIQNDLIMTELPELRRLWDFLRHTKAIEYFDVEAVAEYKIGELKRFFDPWLVETLKYAKAEGIPVITDDFRMLKFLKSENVQTINIIPLIDHLLNNRDIDEPSLSLIKGKLAERFYIFISFNHKDLFEIAAQDSFKITPRSYHLINQALLPGSQWESFRAVFARTIEMFWRAEIIGEDKTNWLKLITRITMEYSKSRVAADDNNAAIFDENLSIIWAGAIANGSKTDLISLLPRVNEIVEAESNPALAARFADQIRERLGSHAPN